MWAVAQFCVNTPLVVAMNAEAVMKHILVDYRLKKVYDLEWSARKRAWNVSLSIKCMCQMKTVYREENLQLRMFFIGFVQMKWKEGKSWVYSHGWTVGRIVGGAWKICNEVIIYLGFIDSFAFLIFQLNNFITESRPILFTW